MEGKRFGQVLMSIRYGLVKLTPELKLIDKNHVADALIELPRRGASVKGILFDGGKAFSSLGTRCGDTVDIAFNVRGRRMIAVALRERSGNVICLIHPLLAALERGRVGTRISRLAASCSRNLVSIFEEAETSGVFLSTRQPSFSPVDCLNYMYPDRMMSVASAFTNTVEKLKNIDLNKLLTVVVDNIADKWSGMVNLAVMQFAVTELLNVFETFGKGENAILHIGVGNSSVRLVLRDKLMREPTESDVYTVRIFSELMKLVGAGSEVKIRPDGSFWFKVFVYVEEKHLEHLTLKQPTPIVEGEYWSYLDYAMEYLSFGKPIK